MVSGSWYELFQMLFLLLQTLLLFMIHMLTDLKQPTSQQNQSTESYKNLKTELRKRLGAHV